jgi:hypothetical protein
MKIGVVNHHVAGLDTRNELLGLIVKTLAGRNENGHCHLAPPDIVLYSENNRLEFFLWITSIKR